MIDDDDSRPRFGNPLGFLHQLVRIAHHADDMADKYMVKAIVSKWELQGIRLKDDGMRQPALPNSLPAFAQHPSREIDPNDPTSVRIIVQRRPGPDPQVQNPVGFGDFHVADRPLNPPFDQPAERRIVKPRMNVVYLLGAFFLHQHSRTSLPIEYVHSLNDLII